MLASIFFKKNPIFFWQKILIHWNSIYLLYFFFSPEKHIFSNSVAKVFFPDPFRISTQNYSKGRRLKFLTASTDDGPTVTVDIGGERH